MQGSELVTPQVAELLDPRVDVAKRGRVQGIDPARAFRTDGGEPGRPEDGEVLGHGRLGDPELGPDDLYYVAGTQLAPSELVEDPPANRVAEDIKRMHGDENISMD